MKLSELPPDIRKKISDLYNRLPGGLRTSLIMWDSEYQDVICDADKDNAFEWYSWIIGSNVNMKSMRFDIINSINVKMNRIDKLPPSYISDGLYDIDIGMIQWIKKHRNAHGSSLKESKDAWDEAKHILER